MVAVTDGTVHLGGDAVTWPIWPPPGALLVDGPHAPWPLGPAGAEQVARLPSAQPPPPDAWEHLWRRLDDFPADMMGLGGGPSWGPDIVARVNRDTLLDIRQAVRLHPAFTVRPGPDGEVRVGPIRCVEVEGLQTISVTAGGVTRVVAWEAE